MSSTTTTRINADAQAVRDGYLAYWSAWLAANNPPDMFSSALKRTSTATAYRQAFAAVQANRLAGQSVRLPTATHYEHRATVASVNGGRAEVTDCNIDDAVVVSTATGQVINDATVTKLYRATMAMVDGRWALADLVRVQRWEGVAGCALG